MMEVEDFVIVDADGVSELSGETDVQVTAQELDDIRAWLSPTEFDTDGSEYRKHVAAHTPATGEWLFHTDQYKNWHDSNSGVLWIQGIPGSGKSVVTANLIHSLKEENVPVLFFFSRRIIKSNSEPQNLVRDCLFQLLDHSIYLQARLKILREQNKIVESVQFTELWKILLSAIVSLPRVYILLDALDELSVEQANFLQLLLELGQKQLESIRLLLTSRPLSSIQEKLKDPCITIIRLAGHKVEHDILLYINHRITSTNSRSLTDEDHSAIRHILCQKGQGLFLYTRLMLDEILGGTAPVQDILQNLPNSLDEMYVDLLYEHSSRSGARMQFQSTLLSWITHASRPLRITEIAALVNSHDDRAGLAENQDAKAMVRTSCGPLLEILDNETIQVIHHSFTEFLLDGNRISAHSSIGGRKWFPAFTPLSIHRALTMACIDYLLSGCFDSWTIDLDDDHYDQASLISEESRRLMIQCHFLRYASENLVYHASKLDTLDTIILSKYNAFFQYGDHAFERWKDLIFSKIEDESKPDGFRPIHVAAQSGLAAFMELLLGKGEVPDQPDSQNRTPAIYASMNGHAETLLVLLGHKCSVTLADADGLSPLHHAAKGNHVQVVRHLLAAGVDPMLRKTTEDLEHSDWLPSTVGKTPIQYACEFGSEDVVSQLLLSLDYTARCSVLPHFAAAMGRAKVLIRLFEYGDILARINEKDKQGNTALYLAVRIRDSATVRVLLDHGADIHGKSDELSVFPADNVPVAQAIQKNGRTALQAWAYPVRQVGYHIENHDEWEKIGVLLLDAGSNTESTNELGETVLFAWGDQDYGNIDRGETFVSLLLKHGANPRVTSNDGSTPLHKPQRRNLNDKVLRLLVKAGADINQTRKSDLFTPLIAAARAQCVDAILPYTQNGALPNMQDLDGNTALHRICTSWLLELEHIKDWLSVSDPSIKNKKGETCLYNLRFGNNGQCRVEAIPLLVACGLDLESQNHAGRTALLAACQNAEVQFIAGLIKNGASATSRDFSGKSCLHLIATSQLSNQDHGPIDFKTASDVLTALIRAGADISGLDFSGNTPFHDAVVANGHFETAANCILELGGIAAAVNYQGQTALHKVAQLRESRPGQWGKTLVYQRIEFLLQPKIGLDLHARDNRGMMAVHYAASTSEASLWKLIDAGADVRGNATNKKTPLHYAGESGQSNVVSFLCGPYKDNSWSVDEEDDLLRTPLHYAARSGNSEAVYHLLKAGANANCEDRYGLTPLHLAAEYQANSHLRKKRRNQESQHWRSMYSATETLHSYIDKQMLRLGKRRLNLAISHEDEACMIQDTIRLLLAAGAEPSTCCKSGQTAYDVSILTGNEAVAAELHVSTKDSKLKNPLADQWYISRNIGSDILIQNLDLKSSDAYTLIETAISFKNQVILDALLKAGVDPKATGPEGLTAVHTIAHWGLLSLMKVVASHIGDLNVFSPPLLHVAASRELSNIQMVNLLITLGANVDQSYQEVDSNQQFSADIIPSYSAGHILAMGQQWWNVEAFKSLCDVGADVEALDADGNSFLQCALNGVKSGSHGTGFWRGETLRVLLKHGVNINKVSPVNGLTPLMAALEARRSSRVIQKILDSGADITLGKMPAIFAAIETEDVEVVKALLDAGADLEAPYYPDKIEKWGHEPKFKTPLLAAAFKDGLSISSSRSRIRREKVLDFLLERGADPLADLPGENSNVFHAIAHFHGLLEPILRSGVALEIRSGSDGRTPLLAACSPIQNLSHRVTEDESAPRALIEAGADIHAIDNSGSTALHLAVKSALVKTVRALLSKGALVSALDTEGLTPLYYALKYLYLQDKIEMVQILVDAGADALIAGPAGETPLHLHAPLLIQLSPASCSGTREMHSRYGEQTEYLSPAQTLYAHFLASGIDISARDAAGNTPLFPYVKEIKGRCEYFRISPPGEADVRAMFDSHDVLAVNYQHDTLLHAVAAREDKEDTKEDGLWLFKELMARGVDPRQENKAGSSALDVAANCGREDILELFARED